MKIHVNTLKAINKRLERGYEEFFIGDYHYKVKDDLGIIVRCEQTRGRTAISDWETVAKWDNEKNAYIFF